MTSDVKEEFRSFQHQTAGATYIMPNGKVLVFGGPITGKGDNRVVGPGVYETRDADELKELTALSKMSLSQITEITVTHEEVVVTEKRVDPTIAQAVADAASNTALETTPAVSIMREKLALLAVAGATKDAADAAGAAS